MPRHLWHQPTEPSDSVLAEGEEYLSEYFPGYENLKRHREGNRGREKKCQPAGAQLIGACKRKEEQQQQQQKNPNTPKKPRLVFTDLQRRTLQAIFKETKRPSKEMQITISQQLGLELSTVGNFFMNARRRSQDKWQDTEDKAKSSHLLNGHHHHLLHLSPTTTT
ncbi:homeobox protein onecut [Caerostris extrusa]|uniref:Homeobox protein onecut n=1 Tax=Caerostris extrusa TaxID=172846 RepID=A0AAV4XS49_CAEEX|nr:homeobox protein onecut [Caerostris extrusa]